VDGEHYHFISEEKFKELITEDAFLEYAHVHKYYYGSPKSELDRIMGL
jgi:guanylate kinase